MKEHTTTIYDISKKAGVSIATVSRVLNSSANVSEATRKKVLDVIEQAGYTPNAFARGLGLNTMKTIGIMAADCSDIYLAKAIYYIERLLRENSYDNILCCTGYTNKGRQDAMNLLLGKKVDGIILVGSNFISEKDSDNKFIYEAAATVPVMLLNGVLDAPGVYCIASDDFTSSYKATKALIDSGRTKTIYFHNSRSYSGIRKLDGFCSALEDSGISRSSEQILYYNGDREDIDNMVSKLESADNSYHFDSVVAADDTLAISVLKYAKKNNLRVPEDISVIGYNNSLLALTSEPELSSINNRLELLCDHLVSTLMNVLSGNEAPKQTIFAGELVKRGSTM